MNHYLNGIALNSKTPNEYKEIIFGAGCFWGVERKFWQLDGVWLTSVGYAGGDNENPTYEQVCYENTNHAEVVKVIYDTKQISIQDLLKVFWECHDPTQGMRQGNDLGTQYRSVIYASEDSDIKIAKETKATYQVELEQNNFQSITTEIDKVKNYYLAEEYHQQYLAKNPNGYCGGGGTGCAFPNKK